MKKTNSKRRKKMLPGLFLSPCIVSVSVKLQGFVWGLSKPLEISCTVRRPNANPPPVFFKFAGKIKWHFSAFPFSFHALFLLSLPCRIMSDLWHFAPTVSYTHFHFSFSLTAFSSSTTATTLLWFLSSPQLNITSSTVEEKLQLPLIARLISRR